MIAANIYYIRGPSKLSVCKIYLTVALSMSVFFSLSNNGVPYPRVCVEEVFVNSSNLQSILLNVLRRVYLLSLNIGQWRRKWEIVQYLNCRWKLLEFVPTQTTQNYTQSCDKSNTFMNIATKNITWGVSNTI